MEQQQQQQQQQQQTQPSSGLLPRSERYQAGFRAGFQYGYAGVAASVHGRKQPLEPIREDDDEWLAGFAEGKSCGRGTAAHNVEKYGLDAEPEPEGVFRRLVNFFTGFAKTVAQPQRGA